MLDKTFVYKKLKYIDFWNNLKNSEITKIRLFLLKLIVILQYCSLLNSALSVINWLSLAL